MVSNIVKQDYSCFLHPQKVHSEYPRKCPECRLPYDFPLKMPPKEIAGRTILKALNRGFYGAVFKAQHPTIRERKSAIKVIPKAAYAKKEDGGYGKDFYGEVDLYQILTEIHLVAHLLDAGECEIAFGKHKIDCYWIEMEYVSGNLLKEIIEKGPENPRIIAQIATDLLDLIGQLQQRSKYHNDLHGGNIKVVSLGSEQERGNAIARNIQTKILDLGSVGEASKSGSGRWSDVHQVANQIIELTAAYERNATIVEPGEQRICARLRQIAQMWCAIDDDIRRPKPQDLKAHLAAACSYGEEWWLQSIKLDSIAADINAVTMPSYRAHVLFYGPKRWHDVISDSGTKLLTGMRGCGKTMLLRSLHWQARIFQYKDDDHAAVQSRIENDNFLALFVSCATLLRGPRPTHTPELVMHRLFLAFALEVIYFIQTCDLRKMGTLDRGACDRFNKLISTTIQWYTAPQETSDIYATEHALLRAINDFPDNITNITELNPRQAFEDLTRITRSWGDILRGKRLLLLLDDVSVRYMSKESVEAILRQLFFQSNIFSFKISTETQTLALHSPGEKIAQIGRDYEVFDLGEEVFSILKDPSQRVSFIEKVLSIRAKNTSGLPQHQQANPSTILKTKSLMKIARDIREQTVRRTTRPGEKKKKTILYWGFDALVGICVGDLGEIITIYERMLRHVTPSSQYVSEQNQQKELLDFPEGRLRTLAVINPWLYAHAMSFAKASYRELLASPSDRIRQYAEVDVVIGIEDAPVLFPKIIELIDAGVFVVTGATSRMKGKGKPCLQFRLAYRKLLGLSQRIPLSFRDRFELTNSRLKDWLEKPNSSLLESKKIRSKKDSELNKAEGDDSVIKPRQGNLFTTFDNELPESAEKTGLVTDDKKLQNADKVFRQVLYDVESLEISHKNKPRYLKNACVIAAIGFEDRSVGSWENLLKICPPARAILLNYPDSENLNSGNKAKITMLLKHANVPKKNLNSGIIPGSVLMKKILSIIPRSCNLIIDITSMTKPLIFELISNGLRSHNEVFVLHTCAINYFPDTTALRPIAEQLNRNLRDIESTTSLKQTFDYLDQMVTGERGPYECVGIGDTYADPSQPVFLAAFVSLKLDPIQTIFRQGEVEKSAVIYPVHSEGEGSLRTMVAAHLGEFLSQLHHGEKIGIESLNHFSSFQTLVNLHRRWSLESSFNFEIALAGTKMHTVGAAMFASTVMPARVMYARASGFDASTFTGGTGDSILIQLKRVERKTETRVY